MIGIDRFGNKYFENMEEELPLRTRWVDFKEYEWDPYVSPHLPQHTPPHATHTSAWEKRLGGHG